MEFLTMESKKKIGTAFFFEFPYANCVKRQCAVDPGYTREKNVWLSYFLFRQKRPRTLPNILQPRIRRIFFAADVIADANSDTATTAIVIAVAIVAIVNISLCKPIFHRIDFRRFSMCTQNLDYSLHKPIMKWITFNVFALPNWKTKSHFSFCSPMQYQNDGGGGKHGENKCMAHRKAKHIASIPECCSKNGFPST